MQPAFNRSHSYSQANLAHGLAMNHDADSPGEHGATPPELHKPFPGCPADIDPAVFQRFIELGEAPGDLADAIRLGIWCMRNDEDKALRHLFKQAGIDDACMDWCLNQDREVGALLRAVASHSVLTRLSLAGIKLSSARMKEIGQAFQHDRRLAALDISWNHIDCDGAEALAAMLATNTSLTELNLKASSLDGECATLLAHALTVNSVLSTLNLNCNVLGQGGANAIFAAMEENRALTSLDLGSNGLEHGNAEALGLMLKKNGTLTALHLSGNKIGLTDKYQREKAVGRIVDGFECNTVLTTLQLERNNLDEYTEGCVPDCPTGRLHDLHERNRLLVPLSKRDGAIYAQTGLMVSLPRDVGELLSRFLILVSGSMPRYRDVMLDVHCALNAQAAANKGAKPRNARVRPAGKSRAVRLQVGASSSSSMHARAQPRAYEMREGAPEVLSMSAYARASFEDQEGSMSEPDAGVDKRA